MSEFNPVSVRALLIIAAQINKLDITSLKQTMCLLAIKSSPGIDSKRLGAITSSATSAVHGFISGLVTRGLVYTQMDYVVGHQFKVQIHRYHLTPKGAMALSVDGLPEKTNCH